MTPFTEEQLREIIEECPHYDPSRATTIVPLAHQCLDLMKDLEAAQCDAANSLEVSVHESFRYKAALARAEAAEALLRETIDTPPYDHDEWDELICAWCNQPGQHEDWCLYTRISAHLATVPQQANTQ